MLLLTVLLLSFGMTTFAAPSVTGDTELNSKANEVITAAFKITNQQVIDEVKLTLSYDKDVLTYMSGSGGNNFSGSGGNGTIQLSSKPVGKTASFIVKFKGKKDTATTVEVVSCVITVGEKQINAITGEELLQGTDKDDDEEPGEDEERASFVIGGRTFYVRRPDDVDGFEVTHLDIQGIDCRVLKHNSLDLYVVKLRSDNGSYRDNFVYNPETETVIPFVEMESGTDDVIFIEPEENVYVPTRYSYVDLGWGAKYTIPAYKHVIIDGIDEIPDDTNRYLIYGINQDGEKAWYSYDYDKNSLQLFDDVAYQGEQDYILELETKETGLRSEAAYQLERYNTDMGHRLMIIMVMTIVIIVLLNIIGIMYFRMKKMYLPEEEEEDEETSSGYIVGSLEENESDFGEPQEDDEEFEIIDLDDADDEE